jgi:hypothetical protein
MSVKVGAIGYTAEQICALLKDTCDALNTPKELGRREAWIFRRALNQSKRMRDPKALTERLWAFHADVTTCPSEVIAYCQQVLRKARGTKTENCIVDVRAFEIVPTVSSRGCASYSPYSDKFFVYARSGGLNCFLHHDLQWRRFALDGENPSGYYDSEEEARAALQQWDDSFLKHAAD